MTSDINIIEILIEMKNQYAWWKAITTFVNTWRELVSIVNLLSGIPTTPRDQHVVALIEMCGYQRCKRETKLGETTNTSYTTMARKIEQYLQFFGDGANRDIKTSKPWWKGRSSASTCDCGPSHKNHTLEILIIVAWS